MPQVKSSRKLYAILELCLLLSVVLLPAEKISGQLINPDQFVADTLHVSLRVASGDRDDKPGLQVIDRREVSPRLLAVRQINKYLIIPVDQYVMLDDSLAGVMQQYLSPGTTRSGLRLSLEHLDIWYDSKPFLSQGWMLNGETRLHNVHGNLISVWRWEVKRKPSRGEKFDTTVRSLMQQWLIEQQSAMVTQQYPMPDKIRQYGRTLDLWVNHVIFQDGYALDGRMSLYYPADYQRGYLRGIPGIYYRDASDRQSIAIGGKDLHWFIRVSPPFLVSLSGTGRLGFNRFAQEVFQYLDWWNLFLVNLGFAAKIQWSPAYHSGFTAGVGLYQDINILPEVVDRFETGVLVTIGVRLP